MNPLEVTPEQPVPSHIGYPILVLMLALGAIGQCSQSDYDFDGRGHFPGRTYTDCPDTSIAFEDDNANYRADSLFHIPEYRMSKDEPRGEGEPCL